MAIIDTDLSTIFSLPEPPAHQAGGGGPPANGVTPKLPRSKIRPNRTRDTYPLIRAHLNKIQESGNYKVHEVGGCEPKTKSKAKKTPSQAPKSKIWKRHFGRDF